MLYNIRGKELINTCMGIHIDIPCVVFVGDLKLDIIDLSEQESSKEHMCHLLKQADTKTVTDRQIDRQAREK